MSVLWIGDENNADNTLRRRLLQNSTHLEPRAAQLLSLPAGLNHSKLFQNWFSLKDALLFLILFAVRSHGTTVPELMLATVMLHRTWGDSALDHPKRGRNLVDPFLWLFDLKEVRGKRQGER